MVAVADKPQAGEQCCGLEALLQARGLGDTGGQCCAVLCDMGVCMQARVAGAVQRPLAGGGEDSSGTASGVGVASAGARAACKGILFNGSLGMALQPGGAPRNPSRDESKTHAALAAAVATAEPSAQVPSTVPAQPNVAQADRLQRVCFHCASQVHPQIVKLCSWQ